MKSPEQMIDIYQGQADNSLANLNKTPIRENPYLLALNHRIAHQDFFAISITQWRFSLADPRPAMRRAYKVCHSACQLLPGVSSPEPVPSRFRFFDAVHLAMLLGEPVGPQIIALIEQCHRASDVHTALDYALALAIATNQPSLIPTTIARHKFPRRLQLYQRTYETYGGLLEGDVSLFTAAEENYKKRGRDNYYSEGFLVDGGRDYNAYAVDYRLAAIIKARGLQVSTVHRLPANGGGG
jgi:hypothetical protein